MTRTRVLLVDDHELARRALRQALSAWLEDVECGAAATVGEAVRLLGLRRWDVILLDVDLPGARGVDVLAEARRLAPRTPILVMSARPEEEFAARALVAGADGCVAKTSGAREIVAAVRTLLAGGRYVPRACAAQLGRPPRRGSAAWAPDLLSPREVHVLRRVAAGRSAGEIAAEMKVALATVATYRARIAKKLGLATDAELARYAVRRGLLARSRATAIDGSRGRGRPREREGGRHHGAAARSADDA